MKTLFLYAVSFILGLSTSYIFCSICIIYNLSWLWGFCASMLICSLVNKRIYEESLT